MRARFNVLIVFSATLAASCLILRPDITFAALPPENAEAPLEEVVTVGTNIRGAASQASQVIVLDRAYIASTGIATTARLMESLPQNFALANQAVAYNDNVSLDLARGEGLNLRGIGEGTTLVLINGRRMAPGFMSAAADISAIPLSAIERVEVLPDGASAVYGSDAVGGVVNFVLRRDYDGAETQLGVGTAAGGVEEYRASQTFGTHWSSGNALISGEYYERDMLFARDRDYVSPLATVRSLLPEDKNIGILFSGRQDISNAIGLFADVLLTRRDTFNQGRLASTLDELADSRIDQTAATLGMRWQLGNDWQLEAAGTYSDQDRKALTRSFGAEPLQRANGVADVVDGAVKLDGPVFRLPGGAVKVAVGASRREESFDLATDFGVNFEQISQRIDSVFGEIHAPLVGESNASRGLRRFDLSLAARYDDYSTFGSSFDPRVGVVWEPATGFSVRGTYGTSFVAPKLSDHDVSTNAAGAYYDFDPASPTYLSYLLELVGTDPASLKAQESTNFTAGVQFKPATLEGLKLSLDYYRIDFRDQVATPPSSAGVIMGNLAAFGSLVVANPTDAQVLDVIGAVPPGRFFAYDINFDVDPNFDPAMVDFIVDHRRRNLAQVRSEGVDAAAQYRFEQGRSRFTVGINGVRALKRSQKVTATAAVAETVGTLFNPPEFRARADGTWQRGPFSCNVFVNYVGSYQDNRRVMAPQRVESFTSVDTLLMYQFGEARGAWSGMTLSVGAQNLFDREPPSLRLLNPAAFELGFDSTNASPLGRLITAGIAKQW